MTVNYSTLEKDEQRVGWYREDIRQGGGFIKTQLPQMGTTTQREAASQ